MADSSQQKENRSSTFMALVAEDPFRLFFLIGIASGLLGISLWLLYYQKWLPYYPGTSHARILVHGFVWNFIAGFLLTALPRLLESKPISMGEAKTCAVLSVGSILLHTCNMTIGGDVLFFLANSLLMKMLIEAFRSRNDNPPPGFVLVPLSLFCAMAGTLLFILSNQFQLFPESYALARTLLYQGLTIPPILGIGAFFFPRFLGSINVQEQAVEDPNPASWNKHFSIAAITGLALIASFILEGFGITEVAYWLRGATIIVFFAMELRLGKLPDSKRIRNILLLSLFCFAAGFLYSAIFPEWRAAGIHTAFIGGVSLIIFLTAGRVVFGHTGRIEKLNKAFWPYGVASLIVFSLLARVWGDVMPRIQVSHYVYAAICWILAALIWVWKIYPLVTKESEDD